MLKSNKANMVLALIVAIVLWVYVLGEINPETNVTVRNVPITFANETALEQSGLTLLSSSQTTVNINISGKRTDATKVKQSEFKVIADLEALKAGENTVRLSVSGPGEVKIQSVSVDKIDVLIDQKITAEKDIKAVIRGETAEEKEPYIVDINRSKTTVTGAKTLVDRVDRLEAAIDAGNVESTLKTMEALLVPVDNKGVKIEGLTLGSQKVSLTAVMLNRKTVHLEVPVINQNRGDAERIIAYPKTVTVIGTAEDLKDVSEITCGTLDVGDIFQNTTVAVTPILPVGIQMGTGFKEIYATVTVKALSKAEFSFNEGDIEIVNKEEEFKYSVSRVSFKIEVLGKESAVGGLTAEDFKISVDAKGLGKGTHQLALNITCSKDIARFKANIEKAEIVIE